VSLHPQCLKLSLVHNGCFKKACGPNVKPCKINKSKLGTITGFFGLGL
jgi:hypothetical protein